MPALLTRMSSVPAWRTAPAMLAAPVTSRTSRRASPPISPAARSARGVAGADVNGEAGGELARYLLADALAGTGDQCN
jgi:hypothetical protein